MPNKTRSADPTNAIGEVVEGLIASIFKAVWWIVRRPSYLPVLIVGIAAYFGGAEGAAIAALSLVILLMLLRLLSPQTFRRWISAVESAATSNRSATRRYEFTASAERWGRWLVVQCIEHPGAISQVSELAEAGPAIVEAIAFVAQLPEDATDVTVRERNRPALDGSVPD